ncbi:MAG: hypothetical protein WC790_02150 [Candidatus Paceibacterota bacterium]|jgi:hypothetical protein
MALLIGHLVTFITMIDFKKIATIPVLAATFLVGGAVTALATTASAANQDGTGPAQSAQRVHGRGPGIGGTITAIQGSTITITDKRDAKTYTIDASGAAMKKMSIGTAPVTETLADLAVGEMIMARGAVSGTSVTATEVIEGDFRFDGTRPMQSNRPGVIGTVTAVQGSTITVTNMDGTVHTVDASEAIVEKHVSSSLSDITVGARINAMGDISGTSVKAKVIVTGAPILPVR